MTLADSNFARQPAHIPVRRLRSIFDSVTTLKLHAANEMIVLSSINKRSHATERRMMLQVSSKLIREITSIRGETH